MGFPGIVNKVVLFALAVLLMGKPGNYKLINSESYGTGSARGFYKKTMDHVL